MTKSKTTRRTKTIKRRKTVAPGRSRRATGSGSESGTPPKSNPTKGPRGDRAKRLLDLVMLLLRARSPVTFREIRAQFTSYQTANVEAGLRAFERDKADLLELGVPVRYITPDEDDSLEEGGYVVDLKRYRLPELSLTTNEVSALVLAASVARAVPGGSTPKIVDMALKKLAFDLPEQPDTPTEFPLSPRTVIAHAPVLVHFPADRSATAREFSDHFALLEKATRSRKRLTLRYQTASDGYVQTRDVDPYGLVYRQSAWILVGHCHLRDDVRSFRVDRMSAIKVAPKPKSPDFERPTNFDVRAYASRSPWTFTTEPIEQVELEIRHAAADIANEDFGTESRREQLDDGAVRIRFPCGNPDFVVTKILAAKGAIVVREGARLRERLTDEIAAVEERYR